MALNDCEAIVKRMVEEAGVKSMLQLDEAIGTSKSYTSALVSEDNRGITGGYLEKYLKAFPDADYNYIFRGVRTKPVYDSQVIGAQELIEWVKDNSY